MPLNDSSRSPRNTNHPSRNRYLRKFHVDYQFAIRARISEREKVRSSPEEGEGAKWLRAYVRRLLKPYL